jgi:hypothetical protein
MSANKNKTSIVFALAAAVAFVLVTCVSCMPPGPPELVITGTVTDADTGRPIAGAKVSDDEYGPQPAWENIRPGDCAPWGAVTDTNGAYRYLTWPEHHGIKAEAAGYKTQRKTLYKGHLVLHTKSEEIIDFALQPD